MAFGAQRGAQADPGAAPSREVASGVAVAALVVAVLATLADFFVPAVAVGAGGLDADAAVLLAIAAPVVLAVVSLLLGSRYRPDRPGAGLVTAARVLAWVDIGIALLILGTALSSDAIGEYRERRDTVRISTLQPGDCFDKVGERAKVDSCDGAAHRVTASFLLDEDPAASFPGREELVRRIGNRCADEVPAGVKPRFSIPSQRSWEKNERQVVCFADVLDLELQEVLEE
jgi:hypothetical protein